MPRQKANGKKLSTERPDTLRDSPKKRDLRTKSGKKIEQPKKAMKKTPNYAGRIRVDNKSTSSKSKPAEKPVAAKPAKPVAAPKASKKEVKEPAPHAAACARCKKEGKKGSGKLSKNKISTSLNGITPVNGRIYWHLDESQLPVGIDKYKVLFALQRAFNEWQPHLKAVFTSTGVVSQGQIVVRFKKNGDAGLPEPFETDVLAYAYDPYQTSTGLHADIFLNNSVSWTEVNKPGGVVLWKVIVHEIGHSLGLGHSADIKDIMYPQYQPDDSVVITQDTVNGIVKLYGAVPSPAPTPAPAPSPAPAPAPAPAPLPPVSANWMPDSLKQLNHYDWSMVSAATREKVAAILGIVLPQRNRSRSMSGTALFKEIARRLAQ